MVSSFDTISLTRVKFSDMASNGIVIRIVTAVALLIGIIMMAATISELKNVHKKALEISHASRSLHNDMVGSAERLDKTSRTLKLNTRTEKKPTFRLEPDSITDYDSEHVLTVLHRLGYVMWDGLNDTWCLMWSIEMPNKALSTVALKQYHKVNHIPGADYALNKYALAQDHNKFMPIVFLLPEERKEFYKYSSEHPASRWVQKDRTKTREVSLMRFEEIDVEKKGSFLQEFLIFTALVDRHKFDIGVYVVITSIDPLRVYIYEKDWLVRYCTHPFSLTASSTDTKSYAVGKDYYTTWDITSVKELYDKYKLNHKESLLSYLKTMYLVTDTDPIEENIRHVIAETLKSNKLKMMTMTMSSKGNVRNYFQLLRFDFLLDQRLTPVLIDIDLQPDLTTIHQPQLGIFYEQMLYDLFSLLGIGSKGKFNLPERPESFERMLVDDRDIQVFPSQCKTMECRSCSQEICQLCSQCMPNLLRIDLEDAYNEHEERRNFRRVLPAPVHSKSGARERNADDLNEMDPKERLLDMWFRGKCISDETWCS